MSDNVQIYLGSELAGLPAPSPGRLWRASNDPAHWQAAYTKHLCSWEDGGLTIDELWALPPELSQPQVEQRRARVDRWLEGVDEFGAMLYAVTVCTHGG